MSKPDKSQGIVALLLIVGLPLAVAGYFVVSSMDARGVRARADASLAEAESALADQGVALNAPDPSAPWTYRSQRDDLSGRDAQLACTDSANAIVLDYPYRSQQLTLCVRNHPRWGEDVFISLRQGGQFVCRARGCTVTMRVDAGEVAEVGVTRPDDGSPSTLFVLDRRVPRFLEALRAGDELAIEANYYRAGAQTARFNISELKWPPNSQDVTTP